MTSMLALGSCDDVSRILVYILRDFEPAASTTDIDAPRESTMKNKIE